MSRKCLQPRLAVIIILMQIHSNMHPERRYLNFRHKPEGLNCSVKTASWVNKTQGSILFETRNNCNLGLIEVPVNNETKFHVHSNFLKSKSIISQIEIIHSILLKVKVGVLRPVQQPGSYWDRSSELPLVGLEPTEVTAYD